MSRPKAPKGKKIVHYPICLFENQVDWINNNPQFKVHKFCREQIAKYIQLNIKIEDLVK